MPKFIKNQGFSSIEEIINDARMGKMFILVDNENRENEGDFVVSASHISVKHAHFEH